MENVVKVFVGEGCGPCEPIKQLLKAGRFQVEDVPGAKVDLIDVTSEEGFPEVEKEGLEKIPSAKYGGEFCKLSLDKENNVVVITCHEDPTAEEDS